ENGEILYQVVRLDPKSFRQRHQLPDGAWSWSMDGVRRIPYRLPDWKNSDYVFIVEGEKDADALHRLSLCATTNPGGAGNWQPDLDAHFKDKRVILLPDNDERGRR